MARGGSPLLAKHPPRQPRLSHNQSMAAVKKGRKKKDAFSAVSAVKDLSRTRIGTVPATRRLEEKKTKPPKHKKKLPESGEEE